MKKNSKSKKANKGILKAILKPKTLYFFSTFGPRGIIVVGWCWRDVHLGGGMGTGLSF